MQNSCRIPVAIGEFSGIETCGGCAPGRLRSALSQSPPSMLKDHAMATRRRLPLRPRPLRHVRRLLLESLEPRRLLAIDLTGVPDWFARGPSPSILGQTEGIDSTGPGENPV